MTEEKLLEIKDLHVTVDGTEVLKGVSLAVGAGEIHALFGPNGSGQDYAAEHSYRLCALPRDAGGDLF